MDLQDEMMPDDVCVQRFDDEHFKNIQLNILRLDKIHPVVSGNKWFKLKYYLQQAIDCNCNGVATFGGAFSNHLLATAYACYKQNIQCIGYVRGEKPKHFSQTLLDAQAFNMQLEFLNRKDYSNKQLSKDVDPSIFFIPEGGYGPAGAKGAAEILQLVPNLSAYTHMVCAAGTGTMLAGIANASIQQCVGVSVMKNNFSLEHEILSLVNAEARNRVKLVHHYDFGGYAKYTQRLIDFMNGTWTSQKLPLDFVYTAKALYAVYDLAENKYFAEGSNILFIHSGGLQGNRSLNRKTLLYL